MIATPRLSLKRHDKTYVWSCRWSDNISKYIWGFLMIYSYIQKSNRVCVSIFVHLALSYVSWRLLLNARSAICLIFGSKRWTVANTWCVFVHTHLFFCLIQSVTRHLPHEFYTNHRSSPRACEVPEPSSKRLWLLQGFPVFWCSEAAVEPAVSPDWRNAVSDPSLNPT